MLIYFLNNEGCSIKDTHFKFSLKHLVFNIINHFAYDLHFVWLI